MDSKTTRNRILKFKQWCTDNGFSESTGAPVYRHSLSVAGSFPSPAAAGGRLFVPDGNRVAAFGGV